MSTSQSPMQTVFKAEPAMQTVFKAEPARQAEGSTATTDGELSPGRSTPSASDRKRETRKRTKTGCLTCRKRRIKCDEEKPACQRCIKSKRTCEGYSTKAVFRNEGQRDYAPAHLQIRPSASSETAGLHMAHGQSNGLPPVAGAPSTHVNLPRSTYLPIVFAPHYQAPGYVEGQSSFPPPPLPTTQPGGGAAAIAQQLIAPCSRNSSTSTASGQSERRISVMSLISPDASNASTAATSLGGQEGIMDPTTNGYSAPGSSSTATPGPATAVAHSSPETDARDSYYYNYYMTVHAMTLSRNNLVPDAAPGLWTQTIPGLINEDPPGKRALFDALIALTAHTRGEEVAIPFETRSVGPLASLIELGIKCLVDIYRDTRETLSRADVFFERTDEPVQRHFRWQILHTLVVCNLSDARTRKNWVNYLADKAFNQGCMTAASESQHFFLCCLRELMFTGGALPRQPSATLLEFRSKYEFLAIPGMDLIYFAMCQDYTALRGICYRILSSPRAEYLLLAGNLLRGAQLRGEPGLETLLADLHRAADKIKY